jgi:hypothetical protein
MVERWPDDVRSAPFDRAAGAEGVALAEQVDRILAVD